MAKEVKELEKHGQCIEALTDWNNGLYIQLELCDGWFHWVVDLGGPKEGCSICDAHWRQLVNTTEQSICGGNAVFLWSPYVIRQTIIFSSCFFLSSFFFFPRLISAVGDWIFTILWHMVWP